MNNEMMEVCENIKLHPLKGEGRKGQTLLSKPRN